jgi:hypothetical protein
MFTRLEPGHNFSGCSFPAEPSGLSDSFGPLRPGTTCSMRRLAGRSVAATPALPGKHYVKVLRQFSGGTGSVTSGQAVCSTCHWEGPLRFGTGAKMLDIDAARHADVSTGDRGAPLVEP